MSRYSPLEIGRMHRVVPLVNNGINGPIKPLYPQPRGFACVDCRFVNKERTHGIAVIVVTYSPLYHTLKKWLRRSL